MSKLIWLSYPLGLEDPRPPAIPAPSMRDLYTIEADGAGVQIIEVASHTGTHVDAPRHVEPHGLCIGGFSPGELVFVSPVLLDLRLADDAIVSCDDMEPFCASLAGADFAMFRFGSGSIRKTSPERFSLHSPGFGVESAQWLRAKCPKLRAIGLDVPSLACIAHLSQTMPAHNALLRGEGRRFLVIEDMNLNHDLSHLTEIRVSPWMVEGMDSAPCSVVGVLGG